MISIFKIGTTGTFSPADEALLFSFILADCLKRTLQGDYWLKWIEILLLCKSL
jgi:hypothetical protein